MTTSVKVSAHCSADKHVEVSIVNRVTGEIREQFVLQDGQTADRVVYDDLEIKVAEVVTAI